MACVPPALQWLPVQPVHAPADSTVPAGQRVHWPVERLQAAQPVQGAHSVAVALPFHARTAHP